MVARCLLLGWVVMCLLVASAQAAPGIRGAAPGGGMLEKMKAKRRHFEKKIDDMKEGKKLMPKEKQEKLIAQYKLEKSKVQEKIEKLLEKEKLLEEQSKFIKEQKTEQKKKLEELAKEKLEKLNEKKLKLSEKVTKKKELIEKKEELKLKLAEEETKTKELEAEKDKMLKEKLKLEEELKSVEKKLEENKLKLSEKLLLEKKLKELQDKLKLETDKLKKEQLEKEIKEINDKLAEKLLLEKKLKELEDKLKLETDKSKIEQLEKEIKEINDKLSEKLLLEKKLKELKDKLKLETDKLKKEQLQKEIKEIKDKLKEKNLLEKEQKKLLKEKEKLEKKLEKLEEKEKAKLDKLQEKLAKLEEKQGKLEERIAKLEERIVKLEEKIAELTLKYEEQLAKSEERAAKIKERIANLEAKLADKLDKLEEAKDKTKAQEAIQKLIEKLLAQAGKGKGGPLLPGTGSAKCVDGMADIFPCKGLDLVSVTPLEAQGSSGGLLGSDIWGWTDTLTGAEYALTTFMDGSAVVDVSVPESPRPLFFLPSQSGQNSYWRDVKTYGTTAYIVADSVGSHGMQIFDLRRVRDGSQLPAPGDAPVRVEADAVYSQFGSGHNLFINEDSGYGYVVGSDTCNGGLHVFYVGGGNELAPRFVGCFGADGYVHDVQCVNYNGPDQAFVGKEICFCFNEDHVEVVDASDKTSSGENMVGFVQLASISYPGVIYTHQGWLSEDHTHLFIGDEGDSNTRATSRMMVADVQSLSSPAFVTTFEGDQAEVTIDHNMYVHGDHVYNSNYQTGLRVRDISQVDAIQEVAFFDVWPSLDKKTQWDGLWSSYVYLKSGSLLLSSQEYGLIVVRKAQGAF